MSTKKSKKQRKQCVVKIKRVPPTVQEFVPIHPDVIPEPVAALVVAIQTGKVEEITLKHDVDPTLWERFKNWFDGE